MVLFVGYHGSLRRNRRSIERHGLVSHKPRGLKGVQPTGVYVFNPDVCNPPNSVNWVEWGPFAMHMQEIVYGESTDLWRVVYCGPMQRDKHTTNGLILPSIPHVTLVTGNRA